jgi:23S rRNA (adenine2030-N6)-methyltransferase
LPVAVRHVDSAMVHCHAGLYCGFPGAIFMNYRHAFHAGNFADVLKHSVLLGLWQALKAKPTPFCHVETHAGRGRYELAGAQARKTGEAADGIERLRGAVGLPPLLLDYLKLAEADGPGIYPGSPLLAARALRADDSAQLCELQEDEAAALRRLLHSDTRMHVHQRDGYAALKGLLPPREKRGVVLIDPPFEAQDAEFRAIEAALGTALQRWPTGIYAVWYPIKLGRQVQPFHRWLRQCGAARVLAAELLVHPDDSPLRLNGTGMAIPNAPWRFEGTLRTLLPVLARLLSRDKPAQHHVYRLAGD